MTAEILPDHLAPEPNRQWAPATSYGPIAERYGVEVSFDPAEFIKLLDVLGISQADRALFGGIEFDGHIDSHDDSDPTGRYDIEKMKIYARVLKRASLKTVLTRKKEVLSAKEINKNVVHETRHFFQHLGHIAEGKDYQLAVNLSASNKELEADAYNYAREHAPSYAIVIGAEAKSPRYRV